jgi:hypothetical protein
MPKGIPYLANDCDRLRLEDGLAYRIPVQQIADRIGVLERTLRRHYPDVFRAAGLHDGRKPFQPTEEQRKIVMLAAGVGLPHDRIALLIGCGERTLEKYFVHELQLGSAQASLKVCGNLFKMATGPTDERNTLIAAIWWTKARMGWSGRSRSAAIAADQLDTPRLIIYRSDNDVVPVQSAPLPDKTMPVNETEPRPQPIGRALVASLPVIKEFAEAIGRTDPGGGPPSSSEDAGSEAPVEDP